VSEMTRKGMTLVALMTMLAAGVAFGEDYGTCYGAYRSSGLAEQQMRFEEFRDLYRDTLCTWGGNYQDGDRTRDTASQSLPGKE
jgi:hypothetical protein